MVYPPLTEFNLLYDCDSVLGLESMSVWTSLVKLGFVILSQII
jgi:hypothetical protein